MGKKPTQGVVADTRTRNARTKHVLYGGKLYAVNADEEAILMLRKARGVTTENAPPVGRVLDVVNLDAMTRDEAIGEFNL